MASVEDKPNDELVEQAEEPTPAPEQVEQPDVEQVDQATFEDVEERGPERCKTRSRCWTPSTSSGSDSRPCLTQG